MREDNHDMIFHRPGHETNRRQSQAAASTRYLTKIISIKKALQSERFCVVHNGLMIVSDDIISQCCFASKCLSVCEVRRRSEVASMGNSVYLTIWCNDNVVT